jgi:hypothetical protein
MFLAAARSFAGSSIWFRAWKTNAIRQLIAVVIALRISGR